jgi:putative tryptophan/tyrosine transport system substrate-binding protein
MVQQYLGDVGKTVEKASSAFASTRRSVLRGVLFALCMIAASFVAAQNRVPAKVGVLWPGDASAFGHYHRAFQEGMRALGWVDGHNVRFVVRYGDDAPSRFRALAAELVALGVDVLVAEEETLPAVRQTATTIPIVCGDFYDPIAQGFTSSLSRPDRNITGVSWQTLETAAKRLELTIELNPAVKRIAVLFQAGHPGAALDVKAVLSAAEGSNLTVRTFGVSDSRGIQAAFAAMKRDGTEALIVSWNPITELKRHEIYRFASSIRLPTISEGEAFAEAGALFTYGIDGLWAFKRSAYFVDKILKGAKPTELPIEQPTVFEVAVNLKTAKALGLTIPESVMLRATKVIR